MKKAVIAACILFAVACSSMAAAGDGASPSHIAPNVDLTTNLLSAGQGEWTRRHAPDGHTYTTHVHTVAEDGIVLQAIHAHNGRIRSNKLYAIPYAYLRGHAIDPASGGALDREVEYKGKVFRTRAVMARINDSDGVFLIADEVPATGILCVEVIPARGSSPYTLWTDSYGTRPDQLILNAGPGEPAEGEFGVAEAGAAG